MSLRCLWTLLASLVLIAPAAFASQPPGGVGQFVPVDAVPPSEQLPVAPLLIGAYAFVWLATMVYVFSIWRRMNKVEADMRALAQKLPQR